MYATLSIAMIRWAHIAARKRMETQLKEIEGKSEQKKKEVSANA
jgi:hypothetical protein